MSYVMFQGWQSRQRLKVATKVATFNSDLRVKSPPEDGAADRAQWCSGSRCSPGPEDKEAQNAAAGWRCAGSVPQC
jgi:hypothetical protein